MLTTLVANDAGAGKIHVQLGNTKLPAALQDALTQAGVAITSATKFTGDFAITVSGDVTDTPAQYVSSGYSFIISSSTESNYVSLKSLYIAAKVTWGDGQGEKVVPVSSPATIYISKQVVFNALHNNSSNGYAGYTDPRNVSHRTGPMSGTVVNYFGTSYGEHSATYTNADNMSVTVSDNYSGGGSVIHYGGAQSTFIKSFCPGIFKSGHEAAVEKISFTQNTTDGTVWLPRSASTAEEAVDNSIRVLYFLKLNLQTTAASTNSTFDVIAKFKSEASTNFGSVELKDTLTLETGFKDEDNVYKAKVTNSEGKIILQKSMQNIYNAGYQQACNDISWKTSENKLHLPTYNALGVPSGGQDYELTCNLINPNGDDNYIAGKAVIGTLSVTSSPASSYKAGWNGALGTISCYTSAISVDTTNQKVSVVGYARAHAYGSSTNTDYATDTSSKSYSLGASLSGEATVITSWTLTNYDADYYVDTSNVSHDFDPDRKLIHTWTTGTMYSGATGTITWS